MRRYRVSRYSSTQLRELIGATALENRMTVVTRKTRDLERFDHLHVIDPWT